MPLTRPILACLIVMAVSPALAVGRNGFDLREAIIPIGEIHQGGPPRDGIPALDSPVFIHPDRAVRLEPQDRVLGLARHGVSKAYPIAILNWHEIVNDVFGAEPVVITYCPLCGTGVAFSASLDGDPRHFGVSGLLYNSDVLLYDRETESLWSQILAQAVSGPDAGRRLAVLPLAHTSWGDWLSRHPDTLVLSRKTGYARDYDRDPYDGYTDRRGLLFPVKYRDRRYHPKERVLGLEVKGNYKAYPFAELSKTRGRVTDSLGGERITVYFDPDHQSAHAEDAEGQALPGIIGFWFAWIAFHPDTEVFVAP